MLEDGRKMEFCELLQPYMVLIKSEADEKRFEKAIKAVANYDTEAKLWSLKPGSKKVAD